MADPYAEAASAGNEQPPSVPAAYSGAAYSSPQYGAPPQQYPAPSATPQYAAQYAAAGPPLLPPRLAVYGSPASPSPYAAYGQPAYSPQLQQPPMNGVQSQWAPQAQPPIASQPTYQSPYPAYGQQLQYGSSPNPGAAADASPAPLPVPASKSSPAPAAASAKSSCCYGHKRLWIAAVVVAVVAVVVVAVVLGVVLSRSSSSSSSGTVTVAGYVTSASSGAAVSGATVGGGSCSGSATSSATGAYSLTCAGSSGSTVIFQVSGLIDFVPHVQAVPVGSGLIAINAPVVLNTWTATQTFNPQQGTTVALSSTAFSGSATLTVPALSASQAATVSAPTSSMIRAALIPAATSPGLMQSDTADATTGSTALQTGGMFYWDFVDAATQQQPWSLPSGVVVSVTSTITMTDIPDTGSANWYSFSPSTGLWTNPTPLSGAGVSSHHMSLMAANASTHAMRPMQGSGNSMAGSDGYWNSDRAYKTSCIVTTIQTTGGSPCAGSAATANGVDGLSYKGVTNADGSTCLEGAQTRSSSINVGGSTASFTFPAAAGSCSNPSSCQTVTLTVTANAANCPSQVPPAAPSYYDCLTTLENLADAEESDLAPCSDGEDADACCSAVDSFDSQLLAALQGVCSGLAAQYDELDTDINDLQQAISALQQDC